MVSMDLRLPPAFKSLSAKLLVLTVGFVMLAEIFIYAPSVARFRLVYLQQAISNAHLATLALEATPDEMLSAELTERLLQHARAFSIVQHTRNAPRRVLTESAPPAPDLTVDLRRSGFFDLIIQAFDTLLYGANRTLRVLGRSPKDSQVLMEVLIDEAPLRSEMLEFSWRILLLSLLISYVTAVLVFATLHWLTVRPLRKLTENMIGFSGNPEDARLVIEPGYRADEIGVAQRELRNLQIGLRAALRQRARLATLGTAVTKINHDLRNMLATAQLVSDRLADSDDPQVQKALPTLMRSIDRAVHLCTQTLDFARNQGSSTKLDRFSLGELVEEVYAGAAAEHSGKAPAFVNHVADDVVVHADRAQLFRLVNNLVRNATKAGACAVIVEAVREDGGVTIDLRDDGPGLPDTVLGNMFEAFKASHNGGTGLGLAIAKEVADAHNGDITLVSSGAHGCHFRVTLPQA